MPGLFCPSCGFYHTQFIGWLLQKNALVLEVFLCDSTATSHFIDSMLHQLVRRITFMYLPLQCFFFVLLYLLNMNWTCCVSYGFHNAVLHSSSWHSALPPPSPFPLSLPLSLSLSLIPLFLLSFFSLTYPPIMQSQQKSCPLSPSLIPSFSLSLTFSAFLTQSKANWEKKIRRGGGWSRRMRLEWSIENEAKIKGFCIVLVYCTPPGHRWIQGHLFNVLRTVVINMCTCECFC